MATNCRPIVKNKSLCIGIGLIEVIFYVALVALLSGVFFRFVVSRQLELSGNVKSLGQFVKASCACDVFVRDAFQAPADLKCWKSLEKNCLIWQAKKNDIGWLARKDKLVRVSGNYNQNKKRWEKSFGSCVFYPLKDIEFVYFIDEQLQQAQSVKIILTYENGQIERNVILKNGALV